MGIQAALNNDLSDVKFEESLQINNYHEGLHKRFMLWKDQSGRTATRIAVMLGRSVAAVSQYANKKYKGNLAELEKDIGNLLRREESLEFVGGPDIFCSTMSSTLIWEVFQYCDEKGKMGVTVAPSGSGKTETCKEYKRQNRATVFITADISTRAIGSVLRMIARHTGGPVARPSISDLLYAVIDRLKGSHRMLIIDDAHFLTWEAFELVRKLHDCAGIGVVYVGQERLYDQMKGLDKKAYLFDQIFSRIAIRREISRPTKKDVRMIADSICPGLDKECIDFLFNKARGKGRFRVMVNLIDVALEMHKQYGNPLDVALLREAEQFLMN